MTIADFQRSIRPFVITPEEWHEECNSVGNRQLRQNFTNGIDGNGKSKWKLIHSISAFKIKKETILIFQGPLNFCLEHFLAWLSWYSSLL